MATTSPITHLSADKLVRLPWTYVWHRSCSVFLKLDVADSRHFCHACIVSLQIYLGCIFSEQREVSSVMKALHPQDLEFAEPRRETEIAHMHVFLQNARLWQPEVFVKTSLVRGLKSIIMMITTHTHGWKENFSLAVELMLLARELWLS